MIQQKVPRGYPHLTFSNTQLANTDTWVINLFLPMSKSNYGRLNSATPRFFGNLMKNRTWIGAHVHRAVACGHIRCIGSPKGMRDSRRSTRKDAVNIRNSCGKSTIGKSAINKYDESEIRYRSPQKKGQTSETLPLAHSTRQH